MINIKKLYGTTIQYVDDSGANASVFVYLYYDVLNDQAIEQGLIRAGAYDIMATYNAEGRYSITFADMFGGQLPYISLDGAMIHEYCSLPTTDPRYVEFVDLQYTNEIAEYIQRDVFAVKPAIDYYNIPTNPTPQPIEEATNNEIQTQPTEEVVEENIAQQPIENTSINQNEDIPQVVGEEHIQTLESDIPVEEVQTTPVVEENVQEVQVQEPTPVVEEQVETTPNEVVEEVQSTPTETVEEKKTEIQPTSHTEEVVTPSTETVADTPSYNAVGFGVDGNNRNESETVDNTLEVEDNNEITLEVSTDQPTIITHNDVKYEVGAPLEKIIESYEAYKEEPFSIRSYMDFIETELQPDDENEMLKNQITLLYAPYVDKYKGYPALQEKIEDCKYRLYESLKINLNNNGNLDTTLGLLALNLQTVRYPAKDYPYGYLMLIRDGIKLVSDKDGNQLENTMLMTYLSTIYGNPKVEVSEIESDDENKEFSNTVRLKILTPAQQAIADIRSKLANGFYETMNVYNCNVLDILEGRVKYIPTLIADALRVDAEDIICEFSPMSVELTYMYSPISILAIIETSATDGGIYAEFSKKYEDRSTREWNNILCSQEKLEYYLKDVITGAENELFAGMESSEKSKLCNAIESRLDYLYNANIMEESERPSTQDPIQALRDLYQIEYRYNPQVAYFEIGRVIANAFKYDEDSTLEEYGSQPMTRLVFNKTPDLRYQEDMNLLRDELESEIESVDYNSILKDLKKPGSQFINDPTFKEELENARDIKKPSLYDLQFQSIVFLTAGNTRLPLFAVFSDLSEQERYKSNVLLPLVCLDEENNILDKIRDYKIPIKYSPSDYNILKRAPETANTSQEIDFNVLTKTPKSNRYTYKTLEESTIKKMIIVAQANKELGKYPRGIQIMANSLERFTWDEISSKIRAFAKTIGKLKENSLNIPEWVKKDTSTLDYIKTILNKK